MWRRDGMPMRFQRRWRGNSMHRRSREIAKPCGCCGGHGAAGTSGAEKRRSGEAEKRRSGEAEKRRSGEAEKRRSGEAEKRRSGEALPPASFAGAGAAAAPRPARVARRSALRRARARTERPGAGRVRQPFAARVARAPALRERRAGHQLNLMEQHQRQHDRAHRVRGEDHLRHRHAGREAFLRAAEDDRDLVRAVETEPLADDRRDRERDREQHDVDDGEARERRRRDLVPEPLVHRFAERDVDDEQDRALIDEAQHAAIALDPAADHRPQQLAGDERHEQLHHDRADRAPRRRRRARALRRHHHADERRRDEDAEQARRGRRADGRRHVALGDRRERDRRLHRRRQRAEKQHAGVQRGRDERREHGLERQAEQREQRERAEQHERMQPPVRRARDDRFARELRAVQEEQQADRDVGRPVERVRGLAAARQEAREHDGADEREREVVGNEAGTRHFGSRSSAVEAPAARWRAARRMSA
ncbi:Atu, putative [Burkholderia pseudomallei 1710b]|uniref:Atu, putative n=1 Tax=Burkholderia pseudomallei (strain 1710b) TaxID=320372 RepID=Q3JWV8_BURP1|nr:Atu, putative [Burkholderia pseudomallei 1710b]